MNAEQSSVYWKAKRVAMRAVFEHGILVFNETFAYAWPASVKALITDLITEVYPDQDLEEMYFKASAIIQDMASGFEGGMIVKIELIPNNK